MAATHPPTLITLVERTLLGECSLPPGTKVLLAVSGGGDSMAMLHVMALLASQFHLDLIAHGVNHGLRSEAQLELDGAEQLARSLKVPFGRTNLLVSMGANLQARARRERYVALRAAARQVSAQFIATAHHADDRAETVLIRLMRGSGPLGLGVLKPRRGDLVRPLIRAARSDIRKHLTRHGISYATDPSNADPAYLRTRVRCHLLPKLLEESPGLVEHLNGLADRMNEVADNNPLGGLGLSRGQATELKRMLLRRREGTEVALSEGWFLRLQKRKLRGLE